MTWKEKQKEYIKTKKSDENREMTTNGKLNKNTIRIGRKRQNTEENENAR